MGGYHITVLAYIIKYHSHPLLLHKYTTASASSSGYVMKTHINPYSTFYDLVHIFQNN